MIKTITLIILVTVCCSGNSFAQGVEKAYEQNKIKALDAYMRQFDSSSQISEDESLDSLMQNLIPYIQKEYGNVFKKGKYKLIQREILVAQSDTMGMYRAVWKASDSVAIANNQKMLSQLLPKTYIYRGEGKYWFFIPQSVIKEFDDFLKNNHKSMDISKEETDRRKFFIARRINFSNSVNRFLNKDTQKYETEKKITFTFYIDYVYFNKDKQAATIQVRTFNSGMRIDVLYMVRKKDVWYVVNKINRGHID